MHEKQTRVESIIAKEEKIRARRGFTRKDKSGVIQRKVKRVCREAKTNGNTSKTLNDKVSELSGKVACFQQNDRASSARGDNKSNSKAAHLTRVPLRDVLYVITGS